LVAAEKSKILRRCGVFPIAQRIDQQNKSGRRLAAAWVIGFNNPAQLIAPRIVSLPSKSPRITARAGKIGTLGPSPASGGESPSPQASANLGLTA